jgi:hypothetical protein
MISRMLLIITFATTISTILVSSPLIGTFAQNDDASNPMTSDTSNNDMSTTNENMDTTSENSTGANEQAGSGGTLDTIKDKVGGILGNGGNDQTTTGENSEQNSGGTLDKIKDKVGSLLGN